jgi:hypothetical protein
MRCFRSQSSNPKRERVSDLPPSLTLRVTFKTARVQYRVIRSRFGVIRTVFKHALGLTLVVPSAFRSSQSQPSISTKKAARSLTHSVCGAIGSLSQNVNTPKRIVLLFRNIPRDFRPAVQISKQYTTTRNCLCLIQFASRCQSKLSPSQSAGTRVVYVFDQDVSNQLDSCQETQAYASPLLTAAFTR